MKIAVWFGCGAPSAVAAKLAVERWGKRHEVIILNTPIKEEHPDNVRFRREVEQWVGQPIIDCINEKYPNGSAQEVWEKKKFMSGIHGAPCTLELKKEARRQWTKKNKPDFHVLGFEVEEMSRHWSFVTGELSQVLPLLICEGLTKVKCLEIIAQAGINIPEMYLLEYFNNNCIGCVKATSPTYWNKIRADFPEVFKERAELSRKLGVKLVRHKGDRIFLDELPPNAKGAPLKSVILDCGIFCQPETIKK